MLGITVILGLLCIYGIRQIHFEFSIYDLQQSNFKSITQLQEMDKNFDSGSSVLLVLKQHTQPLKAGDICSFSNWIYTELRSNPNIKSIRSILDFRRPLVEGEKFWYPNALPDPCKTEPTLSLAEYFKVFDTSIWKGFLLAPNNSDYIVEVVFAKDKSLPFDTKFIGEVLKSAQNYVAQNLPHAEVGMGGRRSFQWYVREAMAKDSWVNVFLLILILFLFRYFFGTWTSGIFLTGSLLLMGLYLFGILGLVGIPIDSMGSNLFLMTSIASIEDFVFICLVLRSDRKNYAATCRNLVVPCFYTTFTTMLGFGSLMFSDFTSICRFGFGAALGTFLEWIITFLIFPALFFYFKKEPELIKGSEPSWLKTSWPFLKHALPKLYGSLWCCSH